MEVKYNWLSVSLIEPVQTHERVDGTPGGPRSQTSPRPHDHVWTKRLDIKPIVTRRLDRSVGVGVREFLRFRASLLTVEYFRLTRVNFVFLLIDVRQCDLRGFPVVNSSRTNQIFSRCSTSTNTISK